MNFYKYHGTANDFVIIDNRKKLFKNYTNLVKKLCDRRTGIGADGLILLENSDKTDFKMVYFNSDGNLSSMCGNGGRCIASFAYTMNICEKTTSFEAPDGHHQALIDTTDYVHLSMEDTKNPDKLDDKTYFLDTGSPHIVKFVDDLDHIDVYEKGKAIREQKQFESIGGTNVNFVQIIGDEIQIRTYERGVEAETYSCGTGVTAAGIVAHFADKIKQEKIKVNTKGGQLAVSFSADKIYTNITLSGPVAFVFKGELDAFTK